MPTSFYLTTHKPAKRARLTRSSIHSILLALDSLMLSTNMIIHWCLLQPPCSKIQNSLILKKVVNYRNAIFPELRVLTWWSTKKNLQKILRKTFGDIKILPNLGAPKFHLIGWYLAFRRQKLVIFKIQQNLRSTMFFWKFGGALWSSGLIRHV